MVVICPSCQKDFKSNQGLSKHRRTCKTALATTTGLLRKRRQIIEQKVLAKAAKSAEGDGTPEQRVLDPEVDDQTEVRYCNELEWPNPFNLAFFYH